MTHITKRFGETIALADVSLNVQAGEVHALIGENGAGKSTLMKILSGAQRADSGTIAFDGQPFAPANPQDSLRAGIAMIYQELNLAPHLTVEANLMLGREASSCGFLTDEIFGGSWSRKCGQTLQRLGLHIPINRIVGKLGVADQQMIEIARALISGARLIIMDEPTSALAQHEVQRLFEIIRQLRNQGIAIVYISHFLEEIEAIADRITILRDGRTIATGPLHRWTRPKIIEAMVGRQVDEMYPRIDHSIGDPLLTVSGLCGRKLPKQVDLVLHRGEILGVAGLVGAGRTEMLRVLFGLDSREKGEAILNGVKITRFGPDVWNAMGVGLLSEDRKGEGLAQNLACSSNITLSASHKQSLLGWLNRRGERSASQRLARRLNIKWADCGQPVSSLSGGNQQKVALARLLYADADVLLMDEPTRGIDVGAKVDIYRAIGELAQQGKAIVMVSSYLPELMGVCDRIAVMSRGVLSPPYRAEELNSETIMQMAVGSS